MKRTIRRPTLAVAAGTIAWLTSVALTATGATFSTRSSGASFDHPNQQRAPGALTSGSSFVQAGNQAQGGSRPRMSEEVFKNVQVLKQIPVDEFMGTMGLFSAALSVCCAECHTGAGSSNPKWEDDPPRKRTARRMLQMVSTLNRRPSSEASALAPRSGFSLKTPTAVSAPRRCPNRLL